jgi:PTH1 family peptidyl-tRNA hydrolase
MIFIALQNPGKQYENTRHNAGAIFLFEVEKVFKKQSFVSIKDRKFDELEFFYSDTFMNLSGGFVKKVLKQKNIQNTETDLQKVYIFFDDINIPIGKFIVSVGVGASSHNGIKSILNTGIKNNFYRVRVGVGEISDKKSEKVKKVEGEKMSDFVLSKLSPVEISIIKSLISS